MTTPLNASVKVYASTYGAAIEQAGTMFDAYFGDFLNWKLVRCDAYAQQTITGDVIGWEVELAAEGAPRK